MPPRLLFRAGLLCSLLDVPPASSRTLTILPELLEELDNRGLLDIEGLDARPDILDVKDWAMPYHQLLRRSFSYQARLDSSCAKLGRPSVDRVRSSRTHGSKGGWGNASALRQACP